MKVIHVIHRFPPYYMAGSEIYTYNLTKQLAQNIDIYVFTRIENPFERPYTCSDDIFENVRIRRVNKPLRDYSLKDKYLDYKIEDVFTTYLNKLKPDLIHIDHLSHLSTNIVKIAKDEFNLPIVFTIHDFWLYCFKGQLIKPQNKICMEPRNCFNCINYYFKEITKNDVRDYKNHMNDIIYKIDLFLSPSLFLKNFFEQQGIDQNKIIYSKYGFKKDLIKYKNSIYKTNSNIKFGFFGRIISAKGIDLLLKAYSQMKSNNSKLLIFGDDGSARKYLKNYANHNVSFRGGFHNDEINRVLQEIDILVVPSIWYENSPLVIQEAFLAGIPVITADIGGMSELVQNGVNGLTFQVGSIDDLKAKLETVTNNPTILNNLKPDRDSVRSIEDDAAMVLSIYQNLVNI